MNIRLLCGLSVCLGLATVQGCAEDSVCDAVCAIENGQDDASQTTYWRVAGLGGGNPPAGHALLAIYADGTGKLSWGGIQSRNCPTGTNLSPVTFEWTQTGPSTILFTPGVEFRCDTNDLLTMTMTSLSDISGGPATAAFTGSFSFGGAGVGLSGSLVSGTF